MRVAIVGTGMCYRDPHSTASDGLCLGYDPYANEPGWPDDVYIEPAKVKDRIKVPPQYMRRRWQ